MRDVIIKDLTPCAVLEDAENGLPGLARRLLYDIYQRIQSLNQQILAYDREIEALARHSEAAKRLMSLPGIGAVTRLGGEERPHRLGDAHARRGVIIKDLTLCAVA